jgi:hypothetical protein
MTGRYPAPCADCGIETIRAFSADFYMVQHELWGQYGVPAGFLCLACLEQRMGRNLEIEDFLVCPVSVDAVAWIVGRYIRAAASDDDDWADSALRWKLAYRLVKFADAVAAQYRKDTSK